MNKKFLSGSALKWIAILLMVIDHFGAVIVPVLYSNGIASMHINWAVIYEITRTIGRLSFPLFCFLLVEGYLHTSNKWKYMGRLFIFALVSEMFFDWAIYNSFFYIGKQNIFFELFLGVILMFGTDFIENKISNLYFQSTGIVSIWLVGMFVARLLALDYGMYGILSIGIIYLFRKLPVLQLLGGALSFYWELPAPLAFLLVWFYNGKRGKQNKYFFYVFYPFHLALFGLVRWFILSH